MLGNEQNNNQTDEQLQSSRAKIDITDYFAKYKKSTQRAAISLINGYYRAISLEGISKTQGRITVDSLEGKDNIETLCEYIFERANNNIKYDQRNGESYFRGLYKYQQAINENIRNPFDTIFYKKLYKVIDERVQAKRDQGETPDKNEIITEVLTAINNGEIDVRKPVEFDITNDFVSRYQNEKTVITNKTYSNQYLRVIFPEVTNDTQGAITADSLEGKDNIETLCEYVYEQINLGKNYHRPTESVIFNFYAFLNGINENIRNPMEYISLEKLYTEVRKIDQNNNLDKDEVIKQIMERVYGGTIDLCRNDKYIYRYLYKKFVITDKFVSSRNGEVSKEERKKFEEWIKPKELDLRKTDSYIAEYEKGKKQNFSERQALMSQEQLPFNQLQNAYETGSTSQQFNNNVMRTNDLGQSSTSSRKRQYSPRHEDDRRKKQRKVTTKVSNVQKNDQTPQNSQENNLALQEITLEVPFIANNNLIQITAYKIPNTDVIVDCHNVQLIRDENRNICDRKGVELFLNNDGHLVTREGYYPIPITHPFAAIVGKHVYTKGLLEYGEKMPLFEKPECNNYFYLKGKYNPIILLCVNENGFFDTYGNEIIIEKNESGGWNYTYEKEQEALKRMLDDYQPSPQENNQGIDPHQNPIPYTTNQLVAAANTNNGLTPMSTNNDFVFANGAGVPYLPANNHGLNTYAPIQTHQNNTNQSTQYYNPYQPGTSNGFAQHNNGRKN